MGQFKPMTKMETTEPSVMLKLKKGGGVKSMEDCDHKPMAKAMGGGVNAPMGAMAPMGAAPMRPSMMARMAAMKGRPGMMPPTPPAMPQPMPGAQNPAMMKKGGKVDKHEDAAEDRKMIKKAMSGKKFKDGGTIEGNEREFVKTKVVNGDRADKSKAMTGGVRTGNAGGYANGGTIEGNEKSYVKTKMVDGDKNDSAKGTKAVKMGNGGGYAMGGTIEGNEDKFSKGNCNTAKKGKEGSVTEGVRYGNGGGYKMGGDVKKRYAEGGNVINDGRAKAYPKHPTSAPIKNTMQSGTFKHGGKVIKFADGGATEYPQGQDMSDISPQDVADAKARAKATAAYNAANKTPARPASASK